MGDKNLPKSIKFKYKISPNFAVYAVNGVYGGLSQHGEITLSFFYERAAIPQKQTYSVKGNGTLSEKPDHEEKEDAIVRDVMFGVSMNPNTARAIAKLLLDQADMYDAVSEQRKERLNNDPKKPASH